MDLLNLFYHTACLYYWRPLDFSGEDFIYYDFMNLEENEGIPRPPYMTVAHYNHSKDTIKNNLLKLLFVIRALRE